MSELGRRMGVGGIRGEKRGPAEKRGCPGRGLDHPGASSPSPGLGAGEPGVQERKIMHKANIFDVTVNVF